MDKLLDELQQRKPFRSLRDEAILNVWRTGDFLAYRLQQVLKTRRLSQTQYNVLRILRGSGADGLACGEIGERMLTRDPDITRLLDRLVRRGLARRARAAHDRRLILAKITPMGLTVVTALELPVTQLIDETMGHMKDSRLKTLIALLEEARRGK